MARGGFHGKSALAIVAIAGAVATGCSVEDASLPVDVCHNVPGVQTVADLAEDKPDYVRRSKGDCALIAYPADDDEAPVPVEDPS